MRSPHNRAVFEHFGQGTQLTQHDYSHERLETVLLEFLERFLQKRALLFSAFAEVKAGQDVDESSLLAESIATLFTKELRPTKDGRLEEVAGELDWGIAATRARVEGHGQLLLLEMAQFFAIAAEKFGITDRCLGTDPVCSEGSFAEAVLYLWDATVNNQMWVDKNVIPDAQERDRVVKGRMLLQSIAIMPAGLDNAWGVAVLIRPFKTWFDLEEYLVYSLCRAIRSTIRPNTNIIVESIIARGAERCPQQMLLRSRDNAASV